MSNHPEISHLDRMERIRAIAYSLWEQEGRPEGCADAHWLHAEALVSAEAIPALERTSDSESPDWLVRESETAEVKEERTPALEQLAKRIAGMKAA